MTARSRRKGADLWLLAATFVIAVAGLIYELIAATASSYLIGDSVTQFSLVIGVFLSSMGLGAWLSRFVTRPEAAFVLAQIALGVLGGFSAPALFAAYAYLGEVQWVMFTLLIAIGALVGAEIPLIARLLEAFGARHRFENVLTADYIGALAASALFPLVIVPMLGLMSASLLFGLLNLGVAGLSIWLFWGPGMGGRAVLAVIAAAACAVGLWRAEGVVSALDAELYEDDVIFSEATPYQTITLTRFRDRTRLFLNGAIQFDTLDERRYHEALVHPAMSAHPSPREVLILGGGDGMAAREALRHPSVETVVLVDLDPRMTEIFATRADLAALNGGALRDPRVEIQAMDAWAFVRDDRRLYDVILIDLPDPRALGLSKLYSQEFYALLRQRLRAGGAVVTQAGSPVFATDAYWSVVATLEAGFGVAGSTPYHVYIPSFGDWGFALWSAAKPTPDRFPQQLSHLDAGAWRAAGIFGRAEARRPAPVNSIRDHALVRLYDAGWDHWFR